MMMLSLKKSSADGRELIQVRDGNWPNGDHVVTKKWPEVNWVFSSWPCIYPNDVLLLQFIDIFEVIKQSM